MMNITLPKENDLTKSLVVLRDNLDGTFTPLIARGSANGALKVELDSANSGLVLRSGVSIGAIAFGSEAQRTAYMQLSGGLGRGLTIEDFGALGWRNTRTGLLDWLNHYGDWILLPLGQHAQIGPADVQPLTGASQSAAAPFGAGAYSVIATEPCYFNIGASDTAADGTGNGILIPALAETKVVRLKSEHDHYAWKAVSTPGAIFVKPLSQ